MLTKQQFEQLDENKSGFLEPFEFDEAYNFIMSQIEHKKRRPQGLLKRQQIK